MSSANNRSYQTLHEFLGTKIRPIELALFLKSILFIKRKFYTVNGCHWFLDPVSNMGIRLLKEGSYEPDMTALILNTLQEGDVFVDLGANEGYFSILASKKVGKSGKVFCIEPQRRLWNVILKNCNQNNCQNVSLIPFAVSDKKEEVSITLSPSINTGSSSLVKVSRNKFWKREKLLACTLDELFLTSNSTIINLIKIDIEGFELFALKGASKLLAAKRIKNLIIEVHPQQLAALGQSLQNIHDLMIGFGYKENGGLFSV